MNFKEFFTSNKIDCNEFTDKEVATIITLAFLEGLYSDHDVDGYRHFKYHCMTYDESLCKLVKCTDWRAGRSMVSREEFLPLFSLVNWDKMAEQSTQNPTFLQEVEVPDEIVYQSDDESTETSVKITRCPYVKDSLSLLIYREKGFSERECLAGLVFTPEQALDFARDLGLYAAKMLKDKEI